MRLMRHKSTDLGFGTYDKVEVDELRRELERLPVASALRMAAGAEAMTVPVTVPSRPDAAVAGRSGPIDAQSTTIAESANVAHGWPSRPAFGRWWPLRAGARSGVRSNRPLQDSNPQPGWYEQPALTIELRAPATTVYHAPALPRMPTLDHRSLITRLRILQADIRASCERTCGAGTGGVVADGAR